jgi:hypothetical protein
MMKLLGVIFACGLAVSLGFFAVLWLLSSNAPLENGPKPLFAAQISLAQTGAAEGMTIKPDDSGVLVASAFNPAGAQFNTVGAVYFNFDGTKVAYPASGRLQLQIEVTLPFDEIGQAIEVQFVQNGLKQAGWQRATLKLGRHTYDFDYDLIKETRTGAKTETLWLRSDAAGRNRPVIWNSLRMVVKK